MIQVATGWEGIHLSQFDLWAVSYGAPELSVASADIALESFQLRKGSKLTYIYDMGDYWRHEVRLEGYRGAKPNYAYPHCVAGDHAGPP